MIEIPEAITLATQISNTVIGRKIINAVAAHTPHKFAWYHGEPQRYHDKLAGKPIINAHAHAGMVEIEAGDASLLVGDGVALRYHRPGEQRPSKHQLLLELDDSSAISASIQMYGGIWCFEDEGLFKYPYYRIAKEKPLLLSDEFSKSYFYGLLSYGEVHKLSLKAFLATEQRIPGFGNGVLQDVLWSAGLHPKRKVSSLSDEEKENLFNGIKSVIFEMVHLGGRDTEKDFFGNKGGYITRMSKNTINAACTKCGESIVKENYMGGSIYYCCGCQLLS